MDDELGFQLRADQAALEFLTLRLFALVNAMAVSLPGGVPIVEGLVEAGLGDIELSPFKSLPRDQRDIFRARVAQSFRRIVESLPDVSEP